MSLCPSFPWCRDITPWQQYKILLFVNLCLTLGTPDKQKTKSWGMTRTLKHPMSMWMWQARRTHCWTQTNQSIPNSTHSSPCPMHVVQRIDAEHSTPDAQHPPHDAQRFTLDAPEMSPSCSTTHETSTLSEQTRPKRRVIATISPPQRSTKKSLEKRTKRMPTYRHPPSCKKPEDELAPGTSAPCVEQFTPTVEMLPRGFIAAPAVPKACCFADTGWVFLLRKMPMAWQRRLAPFFGLHQHRPEFP